MHAQMTKAERARAEAATPAPRAESTGLARPPARLAARMGAWGEQLPASLSRPAYPPVRLQAKLLVSQPNGPAEREADRIAGETMAPSAAVGLQPEHAACCPSCAGQTEPPASGLQRRAAGVPEAVAVPPIVHEVLGSPGEPLAPATRAAAEAHFQADFREVRIHRDERAAASARAVNALAYTVGQHVVFGLGQYAPAAGPGRQLLARELAHVVQQRGQGLALQRQPAPVACPPRPAGEAAQSRTATRFLSPRVVLRAATHQLDVQDFAVNSPDLPPGTTDTADWPEAMSILAGDPSLRVAVTGFTDCAGTTAENLALRTQRTQSVLAAMPPAVRAKVLFSFTVTTTYYVDTNATADGRARNRSVRITWTSAPPLGQDACDMLPRARNLDEYLFLVRCLETRLGLTAPGDVQTALSVLRQIYYGSASWSASQTSVWNRVITNRPWAPGTDPTAPLHPALMAALQNSQVVGGTDIGHILTGIDAMLSPQNVTFTHGPMGLQTNLPNEEWATWAGVVGSAAAEWALDAFVGTPNPATLPVFFQRFASDSDLIGDVDAFALQAGFSPGTATPAQLFSTIRLTGPLSRALLQYFRMTGSALGTARGRRVQNFVEAYGGVVSGRTITNGPALAARLRPSVEEFARLFSIYRLLTMPSVTRPPTATPWPVLLDRAINDMAARFVNWLAAHL
ncbi:MAG TPA: DUF4157 domain-containing protein [Chloroflexota bacterium]|jgi:outer membrane protein OmpA-like peptidoglycan-associated protein